MINKIQKKVEKVIYLYKYIDMNDNITKYVGIVSEKNRELKDRIIEHYKKDVWSHGYFRVEYIELQRKRMLNIWNLILFRYIEQISILIRQKKNGGKAHCWRIVNSFGNCI